MPRPVKAVSPEHKLVLDARPAAIQLARVLASVRGVRSRALREDCEQAACQAQLEALPRYDPARIPFTPFTVFQWKRVAGAVTRLLDRERNQGTTGADDALDETEELALPSDDALAVEGPSDLSLLKAQCRRLTFCRVMGDTRAALQARPDNDALRAQVFQALGELLGGLSERDARILELHWWQDLKWEDIGKAVGLSDRHCKRIEKDIRAGLKRDLRDQGHDEAPPSSQSA